jgi:hypothetical protein
LKLKCDAPLSNVCFQFQLAPLQLGAAHRHLPRVARGAPQHQGKAVQVASIKTRVESAYGFSA